MKHNDSDRLELTSLLLSGWKEGSVDVPYWLFQYYTRLGINELDVMLVPHVMAFKAKEGKDFPTLEEPQDRMSVSRRRSSPHCRSS